MNRGRIAAGWAVALVALVAVIVLGEGHPGMVWPAVAVLVVGRYRVRRWRARRRLARWAEEHGWVVIDPAGREWPWRGLLVSGRATVHRAWIRECDGMPVTVGEVAWTGAAFGGAVLSPADRGLFVVVRLPVGVPPMAMRLPYQFIGDSPRLTVPALRRAFLDDDVPPWTVPGEVLFTVEQHAEPTTPEAVDRVVTRALRVVRLLDLGPDTAGGDPAGRA